MGPATHAGLTATGQVGQQMAATVHPGSGHAPFAMPAQPQAPRRPWTTLVVAFGCICMFAGLVLSIAGVPGKLGYNMNGPGARIKNTSYDPLTMSRAIDANIKLVAEGSGFEPDQLNGYFLGVSKSEDQIPLLAQSALEMDSSVTKIDAGLADVYATTKTMRENMQGMAETSQTSATTMQGLAGDISGLADAMSELSAATEQLTAAMSSIERKAGNIASDGTSKALKITRRMNSSLPSSVPRPQTTTQPGYTRGAV